MVGRLRSWRVASRLAGSRDHRSGVSPSAHVWVRSLPAWHVWNLATIVTTTAIALGSDLVRPELVPLVVAGPVLLLAGYWAMFIRVRPWEWNLGPGLAYVVGLTACFGVLLQVTPLFQFLEFTLFPQIFFLLRNSRRVVPVGAAGTAIALTLSDLAQAAWQLGPAIPRLFSDLVTVAFIFAMSEWIGSIAQQSAERQHLVEALEATRHELADAERQAGVLEERGRLAREIHDTLAQGFASVVTHLEAADASLDTEPGRARRHVHEAERVARGSLDEARGLVWALRPEALASGGLPAAIERVAAGAPGALDAGFTVVGAVRPLHPTIEVTLLRAAQEALTNVVRHAHATRVTITLSYFEDAVSLDVADDGRGFDPTATGPRPGGGIGLVGMRERAEALGGSLVVESAPSEGTTIAVSLPTGSPSAAATDPAEVAT